MRKLLLATIIALVLAAAASAVDPNPTIAVVFDEPINVSTLFVELLDFAGNSIELTEINRSPDNKLFFFTTRTIPAGPYELTVRADDLQGNPGETKVETFNVIMPDLAVELINPGFGVAQSPLFPVLMKSNRDANCKWDTRRVEFDQMTSDFATVNFLDHTTVWPFAGQYFVTCKDSFNQIWNNLAAFIITIDSDPPQFVRLAADPAEVTESPQVDIIVLTDEEVRCKSADNPDVPYNSMEKFPGFDDGAFSDQNKVTLPTPIETGSYQYFVMCEDKAGWQTPLGAIPFKVELGQEFRVNSNMLQFYNIRRFPLNVTTNKQAFCFYSDDPNNPTQNNFNGDGRNFLSTTLNFADGSYTYFAFCVARQNLSQTDNTQLSFSVDSTPPQMLFVNDSNPFLATNPEFTYFTDKLKVSWKAEDLGSGIREYEYLLFESAVPDKLILNQTSSSEDELVTGLSLNDTKRYFFSVRAQNGAGLWSTPRQSDGITVDTSLIPVQCSNGVRDFGETDLDCGGNCTGCAIGKRCLIDRDCSSSYCAANNTCQVAPSASCFDVLKNQDETDRDCGGLICGPCNDGEMCLVNADCKSENCNPLTKLCETEDTCFNNEFDALTETDIDCGGQCAVGCGIGKTCGADEDCISGTKCIESICTECQFGDFDCDGILNEQDDDIDNDGLKNWEDPDDDNDLLCDTDTSPLNEGAECTGVDDDDDNDGILDPQDIDIDNDLDNDGVSNERDDDMDGDGIPNDLDGDNDNDGISDLQDPDDDNDGTLDTEEDTDADKMPNLWEIQFDLDELDPADAAIDTDGDGLTNLEEYQWSKTSYPGLSPNLADTDDDGWDDKKEIDAGTDPTDPEDHPSSKLIWVLLAIAGVVVLGGLGYYLYTIYSAPAAIAPMLRAPLRRVIPRIPLVRRFVPVRPAARPVPRKKPAEWITVGKKPAVKKKLGKKFEKLGKLAPKKKPSAFEKLGKLAPKERVAKPVKTAALVRKEKVDTLFDKLSKIKEGEAPKVRKEIAKAVPKAAKPDTFESLRAIAGAKKVTKKQVKDFLATIPKATKRMPAFHKEVLAHLVEAKKISKEDAFAALKDISKGKGAALKGATKESIFSRLEKIK